jgi:hypothetical protein
LKSGVAVVVVQVRVAVRGVSPAAQELMQEKQFVQLQWAV